MKRSIDIDLLNEAIGIVLERMLKAELIITNKEVLTNTIWYEYKTLSIKLYKDKKEINIHDFMKIPGVQGVEYNEKEHWIKLRTNKGWKTYKTGRLKQETILTRTKEFLRAI